MLKLEKKDYDLNFLFKFSFDFEMLKEILLKLVKSNKALDSKIKKLEKSNKEKDKRISNLEGKLNIEYTPEEKSNLFSNEELEEEKEEKEEKGERQDNKDNNEDKEEREEEKEENKNEKENDSSDEHTYTNSNLDKETKSKKNKEKEENANDKDIFQNKDFQTKRSHSISISRREYDNINTNISYPISSDAIRSLLKLIKENTEKINNLDKNLNKKIKNSFNNLEKKIKDLDSQNSKSHKILESKIKDIYNRLYDHNDKIDGLVVKVAPIDNLSIFKDSGDGAIDATKAMIQILEEKINKKIEVIETKTRVRVAGMGQGGNLELKQKIEELEGLIDDLNKDINSLKKNKNENTFDDSIKELRDLIEKKSSDLLSIIEALSNRLKIGDFTGDKMDDILKNIKSEKDKKIITIQKKSSQKGNKLNEKENEETKEKLSDLKERIKDLNKKINDIDNYFKNVLNNQGQDIGEIKRTVEEMKIQLEKKITKDDLKELYNTTGEHSDELKYIQDKISDLIAGLQKLQDNNPSFVKRLESLTYEILNLKERDVKVVQSKPIDLTKYLDENRLKEILKQYVKINDIIEKDLLSGQIKDLQDGLKLLETKDRVNRLEDDLNEKLNDLISKINKKYLDRIEINKLFKNFDLQMKLLSDNKKNKESENWILAKKPLGCFNCATCEANIKNMSPTNEYLPWNKYPMGERQFHIGQGFSRLLQRINNDPVLKSFSNERKEFQPDNDLNNSNMYSSMTNIKGKKNFIFKINNRENMKEDFKEKIIKLNKNYKLPKVYSNRRKKNYNLENLPLTDEENERINKSYESFNSPKIMKITKKKSNDLSGEVITNSPQKGIGAENISKIESNSNKENHKLEKVRSLPIYENV